MTAIVSETKLISITEGFHLQYDSKYDKFYPTVLQQMLPITQMLQQLDNSPSIQDYFDEVRQRFIDANGYSAKGKNMLIARMEKLKGVVSGNDPKRVMADLSLQDIPRVKRQLPVALKKQKRSKSQGENFQTYYQLFNRVMAEARNDGFICMELHIKSSKTKSQVQTKPFTVDDLAALFNGWPYSQPTSEQAKKISRDAHPYRFWLLPLGIFTGARLNELCQLRVHDIQRDDNNVNVISINDNGFNKQLKNEQSRRDIPICSALLDMGFLEYVQERSEQSGKNGQLFEELSYSKEHLYSRMPSRFFCGYSTGTGYIGEHCEHAQEGALNFKSCRTIFAQRLQFSGIAEITIAHLLGHRSGTCEVTQKHYLDKPYSVFLKEALEKGLKFGVDYSHLHWQHYKAIIESQQGRSRRGRRPKTHA
ncbi:hypothetical protein LCGC14_0530740 [marine sediment metagenome]|uniref:Tyr recombinase domain-containing protein n=1 Tax=marine sediment metagenome TaxID=412755 RepID=A0A0F9S0H2_9ZZZZ